MGIAEWWLGEQGIQVSIEDVREALKLLENRGVIENVILHDGRRLWRPVRRPGIWVIQKRSAMANVFAIHSVGNSITTYLRNSYSFSRISVL